MLDRRTLRTMTAYIVGASVALTVAAIVLGGVGTGIGAAAGGALAVGNWLVMRWVGERLMVANDKGRLVWGTLLGLKMFVLMGICWLVLSFGGVDPIGFTIGLSGLVIGALAGAFHGALLRPSPESVPDASEEQS